MSQIQLEVVLKHAYSLTLIVTVLGQLEQGNSLESSSMIDDVVPTLGTSQRGTWATQLLTVRGNTQNIRIGFQFQNTVMLCEVELHLFYCPFWNIPMGAITINIYNSLLFPLFIDSFGGSVGNVTLTSDMANCESLTRVSIPLQGARSTLVYFIEFTSSQQSIQWIHIAEVRFSNEIIIIVPSPITSTFQTHVTTSSPAATIGSTSQSHETTPSAIVTIESAFQMTVIPIDATPPIATAISTTQEQITTDFILTPTTAMLVNPEMTSSLATLIISQSLQHVIQVPKSASTGPPSIIATVHTDTVTTAGSTGPSQTSPVHIVGASVGLVMGLLLILVAGCMVAICCIARHKKNNGIVIEQLRSNG